jgi:hypothetical protein
MLCADTKKRSYLSLCHLGFVKLPATKVLKDQQNDNEESNISRASRLVFKDKIELIRVCVQLCTVVQLTADFSRFNFQLK